MLSLDLMKGVDGIMKKKLIISAVLGAAMVFFSLTALADSISIEVNGKKIESDVAPRVINDRTVVPVRAISEALNCDVEWDGATKGVNIYRKNRLYMMWLDHSTAFALSPVSLEGYYDLDTPPVVIEDRTMLPLRAVGELLGAEVDWHQETLTASVNLEVGTLESNTGYAKKLLSYEQEMNTMYQAYNDYVHGKSNTKKAIITLKDGRSIEAELYPDIAPKTVENFIKLADGGFYNGLIFQRVIADFMIQGGGFNESGVQQNADRIAGEFVSNGYPNFIKHERGVLSMARTMQSADSASSQFFIMQKDYPSLNGDYAAFGKVTKGLEVVDSIAQVKTDSQDKPIENIVIDSVTIQ